MHKNQVDEWLAGLVEKIQPQRSPGIFIGLFFILDIASIFGAEAGESTDQSACF